MRNFKNAGGYYLTRTGVKMLVVDLADPGLLQGQRCDHGRPCVAENTQPHTPLKGEHD